jgi:hypothetical protein
MGKIICYGMNYGMNFLGKTKRAELITKPHVFIGEMVAELPWLPDRKMRQPLDAIHSTIATK